MMLPRWLGNDNDEYGAVAAHRTMLPPPAMDRVVGEVMELTQCTEARARRALEAEGWHLNSAVNAILVESCMSPELARGIVEADYEFKSRSGFEDRLPKYVLYHLAANLAAAAVGTAFALSTALGKRAPSLVLPNVSRSLGLHSQLCCDSYRNE